MAKILIEGVKINVEGGSMEMSAVGSAQVLLSKGIGYPLRGKIERDYNHTRFVCFSSLLFAKKFMTSKNCYFF